MGIIYFIVIILEKRFLLFISKIGNSFVKKIYFIYNIILENHFQMYLSVLLFLKIKILDFYLKDFISENGILCKKGF